MPAPASLSLASRMCVHHPERVGQALCMTCRNVVCQDCATTFEGINHCRPCLAKRQAEVARGAGAGARTVAAVQLLTCLVGLAVAAGLAAWSLAVLRSWST